MTDLKARVRWEEERDPFFNMEDLTSGRVMALAYILPCGRRWFYMWEIHIGRPHEIEINIQVQRFAGEAQGERIYIKLGDENEMEVEDLILPMQETETYQERRKKHVDGCCP